ncbi:Mov34/MPN/PAD-1 family protein [Paenibacillus periandrae]|uniref:Mov34/MPN/PAD-1 family protein n=1 Tax=Paenibacillus periandrae TaxID=1761741 RepID=UPI001F0938CE|nr:Mov34/MPN/PAD-1 family protein [Paenibacillus periandrae]
MKIKLRTFFWKLSDYLCSHEPAPISVVASRDGNLYEIRENDFMRMVVKKDEIHELEPVQEGVFMKAPKIPGSYLSTIIAFFRYFSRKKVEAAIHIYWNRKTRAYELVCPEQVVSIYQVQTFIESISNDDKELVVAIHSHHEMAAVFSPGDDSNDRGFKVYGIIGKLHEQRAEFRFRARYNDSEFYLAVTELFDFEGVKTTNQFPKEWLTRVRTQTEAFERRNI